MFKKLLQKISESQGESQPEISMDERTNVAYEVVEGLYWALDNRSHVATISSILLDDNGHNAKVIMSDGAVGFIDYTCPLEFVNGLVRVIDGTISKNPIDIFNEAAKGAGK